MAPNEPVEKQPKEQVVSATKKTRTKKTKSSKSNGAGLKGTTHYDDSTTLSPGDVISINLKKRAALTMIGIKLNYGNYKISIPSNIDESTLNHLQYLLSKGDIVKGDIDLRIPKDEDVLKSYLRVLEHKSRVQMADAVVALVMSISRISGWAPKELLDAMRRAESHDQNRRSVVDYLEEAIRNCRQVGLTNEKFDPDKHMKREIRYQTKPKRFGA